MIETKSKKVGVSGPQVDKITFCFKNFFLLNRGFSLIDEICKKQIKESNKLVKYLCRSV